MITSKRITTMVMFLFFVGCAKEKPYDELYKIDTATGKAPLAKSQFVLSENTVVQKGDFFTNVDGSRGIAKETQNRTVAKKYLYVPMTLGTPREVAEADPFYQGQEKLVRLEWSSKGLEVIEMEKDERFSDNDLNDTPVLTIPGDHVSYKCREDSYGKCTNVEEEDNEAPLLHRSHFKPSFGDLKVKEVNELDLYTISDNSCVSLNETKLVNAEVSHGVINVELEKTYKLNKSIYCVWNNYINRAIIR